MTAVRFLPANIDLVAELVVAPDPFLGDRENVCRAEPRHLRLLVAGWMLAHDDTPAGYAIGLRRALELYEGCGRDLLNQQRRLTTADVVTEVLQLVALSGPQLGCAGPRMLQQPS